MSNDLNNVILSDVDGCLLDWENAFHAWMSTNGHMRNLDSKHLYDLRHHYDVDGKDIDDLVEEFNKSNSIGYLPPLRDSLFYVKKLHDIHGFKFHALTSVGTDETISKLRISNLERVFGKNVFTEYHFLPLHSPKDQLLNNYRDRGFKGIWIEDRVSNAVTGTKLGFQSLVLEHAYNISENDDMFQFVKNWKEIYEFVVVYYG